MKRRPPGSPLFPYPPLSRPRGFATADAGVSRGTEGTSPEPVLGPRRPQRGNDVPMREVLLENPKEPDGLRTPVHPCEESNHVQETRSASQRRAVELLLGDEGALELDHGPLPPTHPLPARPCPLGARRQRR